jgi:hypothetical protein
MHNTRLGLSTLSLWNAAVRARAVIINLTRERKGLEREGFLGLERERLENESCETFVKFFPKVGFWWNFEEKSSEAAKGGGELFCVVIKKEG